MSERARGVSAGIYLALCILLGGASAAGVLGNAILQIVAALLIGAAFWSFRSGPIRPEARGLTYIVLAGVLLVAVSLLPLPYSLWSEFAGRAPVASGFELLGIGQPSIPLSLTPERSIWSLLSILPPTALFLLGVQLSSYWRRRLAWVLLGGAIITVGLSSFQLLQGPQSSLRFYAITNPNRAVGFFSSANHVPTLLLCALPFAGVLAARAAKSRSTERRSGGLTASIAMAIFLVAGVGIAGSSGGFALLVPAALGTYLIHKREAAGRLSRVWVAAIAFAFVLFVGVASMGPLNQQTLSDKFSEHPTSRGTIWTNTERAVSEFMPVGSGLGSFGAVYRTFDNPQRTTNEYVNHAHNDYLELALELGMAGVLLIAAFILWWFRRCWWAWREDFEGANMARCGSVITAVLLLHSVADYPLRTSALAAVFALGCAFLVPPRTRERRAKETSEPKTGGLRHLEAD